MKTPAVVRKAGKTHQEAVRNRPALLLEIQAFINLKTGGGPVEKTLREIDATDPGFEEVLESNLAEAGLSREQQLAVTGDPEELENQGLKANHTRTTKALSATLDGAVRGQLTWQQWIHKRQREQECRPATVANWRCALKALATWLGSDYLGTISKDQAVDYKSALLDTHTHSSIRSIIATLKAFWSWGIDNNYLQQNPWDGLTKRLKTAVKREAVPAETIAAARVKAEELWDVRFFIQIYTGCRKGEHSGLRWCDIDMEKKTIRFEEWQQGDVIRTLKGHEKDERTVPIHSKLYQKLKALLPEVVENNSEKAIWPKDYRPAKAAWGVRWAEDFSREYGFGSHNLRSYVVTQLINNNISPFILREITRHAVPGLSAVVEGYVRPEIKELCAVVETLE